MSLLRTLDSVLLLVPPHAAGGLCAPLRSPCGGVVHTWPRRPTSVPPRPRGIELTQPLSSLAFLLVDWDLHLPVVIKTEEVMCGAQHLIGRRSSINAKLFVMLIYAFDESFWVTRSHWKA